MIGQLGVEEVIGVSVHHRDRMRRLRLPPTDQGCDDVSLPSVLILSGIVYC